MAQSDNSSLQNMLADPESDQTAMLKPPPSALTSALLEGVAALDVMTASNGGVPPEPGRGEGEQSPAALPEKAVPGRQLWLAIKEMTLAEHDEEAELPSLGAAEQQTAVAHTCAAYAAMLETAAQQHVRDQLTKDLTAWLGDLFRQHGMRVFVPSPGCDSLAAMVRYRLHARFSAYAALGYEALYARPPAVYVSAACRPGCVSALLASVGLPAAAVRQVPLSVAFGPGHALDVAQLQRMMDEDEAAQKVPLLVLAHAGTPELGHLDNLRRITELCRERGVWCHVTGPSLAALALPTHTRDPVTLGDSLSLDVGRWLDIPCLASVCLYRTAGSALPEAGLPAAPSLLQTLPLWSALMSLGRRGVSDRVLQAFSLAAAVEQRAAAVPKLQLLSTRPGKEVAPVSDINKLLTQAVNFNVVLETLSPVVVFRYQNDELRDTNYLDNLNSWLGQILQRDLPEVPIQLLTVEDVGFCLKFSPLSEPCRPLEDDVLDDWADCLAQQIEILNATVHHRSRFTRLTAAGSLRAVPLSNWAGLGAVRYIPAHLQPLVEAGLTDSGKQDINKLNTELLEKLKSTDSAFSLGDGEDGMVCIRFGMVTMDTDVDELCNLLLELGGQIEESSRFLETMSEMLMKGIEEANEDLKKETENQLWEEGVLRHVPLVGTFVNWWSPTPKNAVKGRKLDLGDGKLETTEETYKSRKQVRRISSTASQPGTAADSQHSRTSSAASAPDSAVPDSSTEVKTPAPAPAPALAATATPVLPTAAAAPAAAPELESADSPDSPAAAAAAATSPQA